MFLWGRNIDMTKALEKQLVKKALSVSGIKDAVVIDAATIETAAWVRMKCRYGCTGYGGCLTCPPHSPTPEETAGLLKAYKKGLLLHANKISAIRAATLKMEKEAFLSGFQKAFGMSAGPCPLCNDCPIDNGCRHPEKARPSLEACGVDVFSTVRNNGLDIRVLTSTDQIPDYYAIVLLE